jgi:hypothetical protein
LRSGLDVGDATGAQDGDGIGMMKKAMTLKNAIPG